MLQNFLNKPHNQTKYKLTKTPSLSRTNVGNKLKKGSTHSYHQNHHTQHHSHTNGTITHVLNAQNYAPDAIKQNNFLSNPTIKSSHQIISDPILQSKSNNLNNNCKSYSSNSSEDLRSLENRRYIFQISHKFGVITFLIDYKKKNITTYPQKAGLSKLYKVLNLDNSSKKPNEILAKLIYFLENADKSCDNNYASNNCNFNGNICNKVETKESFVNREYDKNTFIELKSVSNNKGCVKPGEKHLNNNFKAQEHCTDCESKSFSLDSSQSIGTTKDCANKDCANQVNDLKVNLDSICDKHRAENKIVFDITDPAETNILLIRNHENAIEEDYLSNFKNIKVKKSVPTQVARETFRNVVEIFLSMVSTEEKSYYFDKNSPDPYLGIPLLKLIPVQIIPVLNYPVAIPSKHLLLSENSNDKTGSNFGGSNLGLIKGNPFVGALNSGLNNTCFVNMDGGIMQNNDLGGGELSHNLLNITKPLGSNNMFSQPPFDATNPYYLGMFSPNAIYFPVYSNVPFVPLVTNNMIHDPSTPRNNQNDTNTPFDKNMGTTLIDCSTLENYLKSTSINTMLLSNEFTLTSKASSFNNTALNENIFFYKDLPENDFSRTLYNYTYYGLNTNELSEPNEINTSKNKRKRQSGYLSHDFPEFNYYQNKFDMFDDKKFRGFNNYPHSPQNKSSQTLGNKYYGLTVGTNTAQDSSLNYLESKAPLKPRKGRKSRRGYRKLERPPGEISADYAPNVSLPNPSDELTGPLAHQIDQTTDQNEPFKEQAESLDANRFKAQPPAQELANSNGTENNNNKNTENATTTQERASKRSPKSSRAQSKSGRGIKSNKQELPLTAPKVYADPGDCSDSYGDLFKSTDKYNSEVNLFKSTENTKIAPEDLLECTTNEGSRYNTPNEDVNSDYRSEDSSVNVETDVTVEAIDLPYDQNVGSLKDKLKESTNRPLDQVVSASSVGRKGCSTSNDSYASGPVEPSSGDTLEPMALARSFRKKKSEKIEQLQPKICSGGQSFSTVEFQQEYDINRLQGTTYYINNYTMQVFEMKKNRKNSKDLTLITFSISKETSKMQNLTNKYLFNCPQSILSTISVLESLKTDETFLDFCKDTQLTQVPHRVFARIIKKFTGSPAHKTSLQPSHIADAPENAEITDTITIQDVEKKFRRYWRLKLTAATSASKSNKQSRPKPLGKWAGFFCGDCRAQEPTSDKQGHACGLYLVSIDDISIKLNPFERQYSWEVDLLWARDEISRDEMDEWYRIASLDSETLACHQLAREKMVQNEDFYGYSGNELNTLDDHVIDNFNILNPPVNFSPIPLYMEPKLKYPRLQSQMDQMVTSYDRELDQDFLLKMSLRFPHEFTILP